METKEALERRQKTAAPGPIFVEAEKLFDQMEEFSQTVAKRAYQLFDERGREFGHDVDDWLHAEFELTRPVPTEIKESEDQITVRAEVPGFNAQDIKIGVEPNLLILSGKSEKKAEKKEETKVISEFRANEFYRRIELPAEVVPEKTGATLKDGILELVLAKGEKTKAVEVEIKAA